jgi:uncharacterized protein (TIGR00369 family)
MTMTADDIERLVDEQFPQARGLGWRIDEVGSRFARVSLPAGREHLRPGDTVSGPTLMALADTATWFALLATLGPLTLAVTTHMSIDFLRRPRAGELVARADLVKVGRRLVVGNVRIHRVGESEPVAQASVTYALPPPAARISQDDEEEDRS